MKEKKIIEELNTFPKSQTMNEASKQEISQALHNEIQKEKQQDKKKQKWGMMKKVSFGIANATILLIIFAVLSHEIGLFSMPENNEQPPQQASEATNEATQERTHERTQENEETDAIATLDEKQVLAQYKQIFQSVVDNADDNLRVQDFQSKAELTDHFTEVMSQVLAQWHADTFFREENDALYVVATESPVWLDTEQPYELQKVDQKEYHVIQERNNELIGHVNMIYILTYEDGEWILQDITSEDL